MSAKRRSGTTSRPHAGTGSTGRKTDVDASLSRSDSAREDRRVATYRVLFVIGVAFYAIMIAAGMVYALRTDGKPPGLATDYQIAIRKYAAAKDPSDADIEKAIHLARLATKLDSANPHVAHSWLGWWLLAQGKQEEKSGNSDAARKKFEEAADHYRTALAYQRNYVSATYGYSRVLASLGDFSQARQMMHRTVQLKPDFPSAERIMVELTNRWCESLVRDAREHYQRNEIDQAITGFQQAISVCPTDPKAFDSLAEIWATHADARFRNGEEAVKYAKTAVDLTHGEYPFAFRTLAAAYAEAGQFDQALAAVTQGIQVAEAKGESGLVSLLRQHAELYRSNRPVRRP